MAVAVAVGGGGVAKPCRGKDNGEEGRRDRHDEGGGRPTSDHAGLVALPSIRQRMGDLQEVGEGWRWGALPATNPGSSWQ